MFEHPIGPSRTPVVPFHIPPKTGLCIPEFRMGATQSSHRRTHPGTSLHPLPYNHAILMAGLPPTKRRLCSIPKSCPEGNFNSPLAGNFPPMLSSPHRQQPSQTNEYIPHASPRRYREPARIRKPGNPNSCLRGNRFEG